MIVYRYNIPVGTVEKLVLNFFNKEKYALHYENLQLYFKHELQALIMEPILFFIKKVKHQLFKSTNRNVIKQKC